MLDGSIEAFPQTRNEDPNTWRVSCLKSTGFRREGAFRVFSGSSAQGRGDFYNVLAARTTPSVTKNQRPTRGRVPACALVRSRAAPRAPGFQGLFAGHRIGRTNRPGTETAAEEFGRSRLPGG
jgi:hypothetical protein